MFPDSIIVLVYIIMVNVHRQTMNVSLVDLKVTFKFCLFSQKLSRLELRRVRNTFFSMHNFFNNSHAFYHI